MAVDPACFGSAAYVAECAIGLANAEAPSRHFTHNVCLRVTPSMWPTARMATQPATERRLTVTEIYQGPGPASDDLVVATVEEEIRREALRVVDSIDPDDEHWRVEPLPEFIDVAGGEGLDGDPSDGSAEVASAFETSEEANRHNN